MGVFRSAGVLLTVLLLVGAGLAADPKPSAPTKEDVELVHGAVARLGGQVVDFPVKMSLDWGNGDIQTASAKITTFRFESATDDTFVGLPVVPFPFGLAASSPKLTDKGVKALTKQKNLKQLDFDFAKLTGGGLAELAGLPQLEALSVGNCTLDATGLGGFAKTKSLRYLQLLRANVGDEAMKEVGQLTSLRVLELHGNRGITDTGVAKLKGLTELIELDLSGTKLKGETLDELQKATRLKRLHLGDTALTDEGLKRAAKLTGLKRLQVGFNRGVTDVGAKELRGLKGLESLSLDVTNVTDRGLEDVGSLTKLTYLGLFGTSVTDAGLKHLTGLKELLFLKHHQTKVTENGIKELQKSLPNLIK